jgi:hypothetical protein
MLQALLPGISSNQKSLSADIYCSRAYAHGHCLYQELLLLLPSQSTMQTINQQVILSNTATMYRRYTMLAADTRHVH